MIRWMRRVLPSAGWLGLFWFCYVVAWLPELLARYYDLPLPRSYALPRFHFLLGACVAYGGYRVLAFHPLSPLRPGYLPWLRTTPWSDRLALPLGPVHLVWQDVVVLLALLLLGAENPHSSPPLYVLAFLIPYLLGLAGSLIVACACRQIFAILFGLGLVVRLWENSWAAAGVAVLFYGVALLALRRHLYASVHPSEPGRWPPERTRPRLPWPYPMLSAFKTTTTGSAENALLASALMGWLSYVLVFLIGPDPESKLEIAAPVWVGVALLGPWLRLLVYRLGHAPPISLWGRIRTGRWIIPGYDQILVTPLVALSAGLILSGALGLGGVPVELGLAVTVFVVLLILLLGGPTFERWHLTGHHRLSVPLQNSACIRI